MVDATDTHGNASEWSVSELSSALKRTVEDAFGHVRVRGEISGYRGPHSSGHAYFSLKDAGARIDAVVWKGNFARLRVRPEEGLEVIAIGRLTTYPGKSSYQIVIESLEFAGAGAIMAMLEERKRRLAAEGLFDPARKVMLPFLPRVIGVVTSPTGAVIRDILHRLSDRFPRRVLVWPVRVQGETSGEEVAAAIRGFNALPVDGAIPRPDVIVVARGGGSLEDLLGFSDEVVVRAAADSAIPLVSAVGHETDVTLIDFAADMRAPTPTAAAEMVVPVRSDLIAGVEGLGARLAAAPVRLLERRRADLRALTRLLPRAEDLLAIPRQRLDQVADRLPRALKANASAHRLRLTHASARLSPEALRTRLARARDRFHASRGRFHAAGLVQRRDWRRQIGQIDADMAHARRALERQMSERHRRLAALAQLLRALSYQGVLERGFALVRDEAGQMVRRAAALAAGARLELEFADGRRPALALDGDGGASPPDPASIPAQPPRRAPPRRKPVDKGPTLFDL